MRKNMLCRKSALAAAVAVALSGISGTALAQTDEPDEDEEVIIVTGIRDALASALSEKRNADSLVEVIQAEDIGKLPDQNLAEVLENITGVQIDRTNGVGTSVQIRGVNENRVEINGVSTVTSGAGRTGISFQDLPAALIASLEVTKSPTAKTIEGSVGGTINLRTLRGNGLKETLAQVRVQGENSDLADSTTPRISGTFGDNWETDFGKLGVVVTGSYAELDVASANPRFDRDRVVLPDSGLASAEEFPFLRTQFLDQPTNAQAYETKNMTLSLELETDNDVKFYFDATLNDQQVFDRNSRVFFSGTGGNPVINNTNNTGFETIDLGSVDGEFGVLDLGEVTVVTSGILGVGSEIAGGGRTREDPNVRTGNGNNARFTDSSVFAFGSEWYTDTMKMSAEISYSDSDTNTRNLQSSLDFVNPRTLTLGPDTFEDNGVPAIFNIAGDTFEFGIAQGLPETPTTAELLEPPNYALRNLSEGFGMPEASETAARFDVIYDATEFSSFFTDISAGIRWNKTTNSTESGSANNNFRNWNRPRANLFSSIVTPGANNFDTVDNRTLFIADYLIIDNDLSFNDPEFVINAINQAITQNNADFGEDVNSLLGEPEISTSAFFDIEETTTAFYLQGDFETEVGEMFISGNVGLRYVQTDVDSTGLQEVATPDGGQPLPPASVSESSSYDFVLPRLNVTAEITDDLVARFGVGKDIRRPDFNDLSPSPNFTTNLSRPVSVGNPFLEAEEIWSYDLSLEYYLSPSAFVSVGLFRKERTNLITNVDEEPAEPIGPSGQVERDTTPPCEGGGIYNPLVPWETFNVFSTVEGVDGICVARSSVINASGEETQTGIEIAAQYDLADFEDELGWASGFGIIANYTIQESGEALDEFRSASAQINQLLGRTDTNNSTPTLDDDVVTQRVTLPDLSENAYNITLFYDKHDLSVRMRYTWRDSFIEVLNRMRFNIPPVVGARGQLNLSVSYDVNEHLTVGVEGVNLTREDRTRWCFNENTLLCEQSLTDRRITFGVTGRW